jgi:hypothetical protein
MDKIELTPALDRMLGRMRAIQGIVHREADAMASDDPLWDEYRDLLEQVVPVFQPLLTKLVQAGLITVEVKADMKATRYRVVITVEFNAGLGDLDGARRAANELAVARVVVQGIENGLDAMAWALKLDDPGWQEGDVIEVSKPWASAEPMAEGEVS